MHEVSIVRQFLAAAEEELAQVEGEVRPTSVTLVVGRLSGASAEAIRFAFEVLAKGTRMDDCRLIVEEPSSVCKCRACGKETEVSELVVACPACGGSAIKLEGGRELRLESIELAD